MVFRDEIQTVLKCPHFCFKLNFNEKINTKKARSLDIELLHAKKVSQDRFPISDPIITFNI